MTVPASDGRAPVRLAIVGAGAIARHHLRALEALQGDAVLVAICDASRRARDGLAREGLASSGEVRLVDDHRALDSVLVDAAIVALPHQLHASVAGDLVQRGIHVLVEKPLTRTVEEAITLDALARDAGVIAMAAMVRRFAVDVDDARAWLSADPRRFGDLRSFDMQVWQNIDAYVGGVGPDHWLLDGERAGGGVVISVAIHQLDLLRNLTGVDVVEVIARGRFDPPLRRGAESSASVLLTMSNGATGTLHATYTAPRVPYCEAFTIFGTTGTLTMHADTPAAYHGRVRVASAFGHATRVWDDQFAVPELAPPASSDRREPFARQLAAFVAAVTGAAPNPCGVEDQLNTLATIEAIGASMRSGQPVVVGEASRA